MGAVVSPPPEADEAVGVDDGDDGPHRRDGRSAWWGVAVVAAAMGLLEWWVLGRSSGPALLWDGLGYLGTARWLGGAGAEPWLGSLTFYNAGYPLLIAPFTVWFESPERVHRAALVVNVVASLASVPVLFHLARSLLGASSRRAVLAVVPAALYPPLVLQAGLEWPENVFATGFVATTAVVWWYARRRSAPAAVAIGVAPALLYLVHPRALGVLVVTAAVLVVDAARRRVGPSAALLGLVAMLGLFSATQALHAAAREALYDPTGSRPDRFVGYLLDPSAWPMLALRGTGQLWYLVAATAGLAVVGVVVVARLGASPRADGTAHAARLTGVWILATTAAVLVASVLQLGEGNRVDHFVYGRYVEALAPVLLVAGATGLLGRLSRRAVAGSVAASAAFLAGAGALLWATIPERFTGTVAPMNVFGILAFDRTGSTGLAVVQVTALAVLAVLVVGVAGLVAVRWPPVVVALLAVASVVVVVDVERRVATPFKRSADEHLTLGSVIATVRPERVVFADASYHGLAYNRYQYENPTVPFDIVASPEREAGDVIVVHRPDWSAAEASGATLLAAEPWRNLALWVLPGPLHDRLEAEGRLPDDH